jgi:predicted nucleic acid-binding protein
LGSLIDSNIAIYLRDRHADVRERIAALSVLPAISSVTAVELEGGIVRVPELAEMRRARVDALLAELAVLPFDGACANQYGRIVAATGWSRPRIFDRMIAATALLHDLTLITMNGDDFRDIPNLKLEVWPSPV